MSLKSVPGCLVSMPPRTIGVPVAAVPGLVPHAEALTVPELELELAPELDGEVAAGALADDDPPTEALLPLLLELHPARTPPAARTAARTTAGRHLR